MGPDADILEFGEKLYDRGYCSDFDRLQEMVKDAYRRAEANEPVPNNPFQILKPSPQINSENFPNPYEERKKQQSAEKPKPLSLRMEKSADTPVTSQVEPGQTTADENPKDSVPAQPPPKSSKEATKPSIPPIQPWKPSSRRRKITLSSALDAPSAQSAATTDPEIPPITVPNPVKSDPTPNSTPGDSLDFHQSFEEVPQQATQRTDPHLSKEIPPFSLDVPDDWPNFSAVAGMQEEALRQCLVQLLIKCRNEKASDLHLSAGCRPFMRKNREIIYLGSHVLSSEESQELNTALLSPFQKHSLEQEQDLDHALALNEHHRYRVNLMAHKEGYSGTYRIVPSEVRSLEDLGFREPGTVRDLLSYHNGLIMVTGPLGSGKTTTLAALVDELNKTRQDHIITVESPIEIVQHSDLCQITQREVGSHTETFQSALKGALRQDPDIIVIGEMRDLETVEMAISASETGHLVIGTMHTSDAANTLNRLLDVFPAAQQTQIRSMVAESLRGILCQRLLPSPTDGVALAYELLLNNAAVGNLIRSNKADGLSNIIETGRSEGMVLMDKSIYELWQNKQISDATALTNLQSDDLKQRIHSSNAPPADTDDPVKRRFSLRN